MRQRLTQWGLRLRSLLRRRVVEQELTEELRFHLERETSEQIARGLTPAAARLAARRTLGADEPIKEACRDARGTRPIEDVVQDLRYGLRLLRRSPAFTVVAVLSLALGIGANTAIFTLVDAVLVRLLPVVRPHELVFLSRGTGPRPSTVFSADHYRAFRAQQDVLTDVATFRPWALRVTLGGGEPQPAAGQFVSGNYYALLGLRAARGRLLTDDDDPAAAGAAQGRSSARVDPVAVISYGYWQRQFGGDPAIIGRQIALPDRPVTIVGVTPPEFFGTEPGRRIDITVPLGLQPVVAPGGVSNRNARWLRLIGRLAPGVAVTQAEAKLALTWDQLRRETLPPGRTLDPDPFRLLSGARGQDDLRHRFSLQLRVLMGTVCLVLLLACANLASLLLARASARRHEIGLRLALGAGRGRLLRQLIAESLLLAAIGGVAGMIVSRWGVRLLSAMMSGDTDPASLRGALDLSPNLRTILFTLAVSVATGLLFGIVPALRATRVDLSPRLRDSATTIPGGRTRWVPVMVATQTALCLLLLSGAALFLRTLVNLRHTDGAFRSEPVLFVGLRSNAPPADTATGARARAIFRDLQARLPEMPGVTAATLTMDSPASGLSWGEGISVPGRTPDPRDAPGVWVNHVGPRFFETMGIPLRAGRDVRETDDERAPPVVIVSESLARHYFGDQPAVGRSIVLREQQALVVGVAKDVKYESLRADAPEYLYRPYLQRPPGAAKARDWALGDLKLALRTTVPPAILQERLRAILRDAAPGLGVARITRLDEQIDATLLQERMVATLSAFFGGLALLLACIGLYGTLASTVVRRTREIGVRLALGASRGAVAWMVMRHALLPVIAGLAIGIAAALAASGLIRRLLFGLAPTDPASYASAIVVLVLCAACAAYIPARRAGRIDPMAALRGD